MVTRHPSFAVKPPPLSIGNTRILAELMYSLMVLFIIWFIYVTLSNTMEWLFTWSTGLGVFPSGTMDGTTQVWRYWPVMMMFAVLLYVLVRVVRRESGSQEVQYQYV